MARGKQKIRMQQYGEPTTLVSVRLPETLHKEIKARANKDRVSKSRKIVQMLNDAARDTAVFEPAESVFE